MYPVKERIFILLSTLLVLCVSMNGFTQEKGISLVSSSDQFSTYKFYVHDVNVKNKEGFVREFMVKEGVVSCDVNLQNGSVMLTVENGFDIRLIYDIADFAGHGVILPSIKGSHI